MSKFKTIGDILNKNYGQKSAFTRDVEAALVCDKFNEIIKDLWGDKIKKQAQAMYVKDGILTVACLSTVVAQEFKLHNEELVSRLNGEFGREIVREMRILM